MSGVDVEEPTPDFIPSINSNALAGELLPASEFNILSSQSISFACWLINVGINVGVHIIYSAGRGNVQAGKKCGKS